MVCELESMAGAATITYLIALTGSSTQNTRGGSANNLSDGCRDAEKTECGTPKTDTLALEARKSTSKSLEEALMGTCIIEISYDSMACFVPRRLGRTIKDLGGASNAILPKLLHTSILGVRACVRACVRG